MTRCTGGCCKEYNIIFFWSVDFFYHIWSCVQRWLENSRVFSNNVEEHALHFCIPHSYWGSFWLGNIEHCVTSSLFRVIPLWDTHYILSQNLKVISVWVLPLINVQVSTFIINVKLPHTNHICNSFSTLPIKCEFIHNVSPQLETLLSVYTCTIVDTFQQTTFT